MLELNLEDWNQKKIIGARSRGTRGKNGVLALADFSDNLIKDTLNPWPPSTIVQKLYRSDRIKDFPDDVKEVLTSKLGFYSDLQSIHSEDAITWSFFGTLATAEEKVRIGFLNWLLERIGVRRRDTSCTIDLWRRIVHPEKLTSGGPEIDFLLAGNTNIVLGEAKWRSKEALNQGVAKNKGQLQLRCEFAAKYGKKIYGSMNFTVVRLIWKHSPRHEQSDSNAGVDVRTILWEDLLDFKDHPKSEEFRKYYNWKARHSLPL